MLYNLTEHVLKIKPYQTVDLFSVYYTVPIHTGE